MRKIYLSVLGLVIPGLMLVYLSLYNRANYNLDRRLATVHVSSVLSVNPHTLSYTNNAPVTKNNRTTLSSSIHHHRRRPPRNESESVVVKAEDLDVSNVSTRHSCRFYRENLTDNLSSPCVSNFSRYALGVRDDKPLDLQFETCALVSTSGHLLDSGRGTEIDSADTVLRMNIGPVRNYTSDVGNRTDVRITSHNSSLKIKSVSHPRYLMVWGPHIEVVRTPGHEGGAFKRARDLLQSYPDEVDEAFVILGEEMDRSDALWSKLTHRNRIKEGCYISTGFFSIVFALNVCERVKVYGISPEDYCNRKDRNNVPYHYYGEGWNKMMECDYLKGHQAQKKPGTHRFLSEKKVFLEWTEIFKLTFHEPDWDL